MATKLLRSAIYPFVPEATGNFGINAAINDDALVRTEEGWKLKYVKVTPLFFTNEWFNIMGLDSKDATYAIAKL